MKNQIYILITIGLIIISSASLLIYYSQEFNETITILDSINYNNIDFKTYERNGETFLIEAKAKLGEIELENQGYFPRKYSTNFLTGCIELKENPENQQLKIDIFLTDKQEAKPFPYSGESTITIPAEETKTLVINGNLRQEIPLNLLSEENIANIKIYKISKKESNPLGGNYYEKNPYYYSCSQIKSEFKPIKTMTLN